MITNWIIIWKQFSLLLSWPIALIPTKKKPKMRKKLPWNARRNMRVGRNEGQVSGTCISTNQKRAFTTAIWSHQPFSAERGWRREYHQWHKALSDNLFKITLTTHKGSKIKAVSGGEAKLPRSNMYRLFPKSYGTVLLLILNLFISAFASLFLNIESQFR